MKIAKRERCGSKRESTVLQQKEMPRGMSGSGSADKALGAMPTDHPPPTGSAVSLTTYPLACVWCVAGKTHLIGVTLPFVWLGGQPRK
jgi:hypothetical protein